MTSAPVQCNIDAVVTGQESTNALDLLSIPGTKW